MSNDELQKAIDDITRDNAAPMSEKASAETEALVDEMVSDATRNNGAQDGGAQSDGGVQSNAWQGQQGGDFGVPPAPAPKVAEVPGMPPEAPRGAQGPMPEMPPMPQDQRPEREAPRVNRGLDVNSASEGMAPIAAFSGVKVETPEVPETPREFEKDTEKDYGKEMEKATVLSDVAKEAIRELYPLLDKVEVSAEEKFEICMEVTEEMPEAISGALDAAKRITDDKSKAEALLKIINYSK